MRKLRLGEIKVAAAAHYGVDLTLSGRSKRLIEARRCAYQAMRYEGYSYPEIGRHFEKDHTTIMNGCRRAVADEDLYAVLERAKSYALESEMAR